MTSEISPSDKFSNILNLPKDKSVLDYIKKRLAERSSLERFEVLNELFEMYRTSTGFDPLSLSKGRFKRIKASALKQILADINKEIPSITSSTEYQQYLHSHDRSSVLFEKLKAIKLKIENNEFSVLEKDIRDLREQIVMAEDGELLMAFVNLFKPFLKEKNHFQ